MTTYKQYMDAVNASDLAPTPRSIAKAFAYHANWKTGGSIFPGNALIAKETGYGQSTVDEWAPKLVKAGWLELIRSGRGGNSTKASEYHLSIPGQTPATRVSKAVQTPDDGISNPGSRLVQTPGAREQQSIEQPIEQTNSDDASGAAGESLVDLDLLAKILSVDSLRANIISLANSLATEYGAAVVLSVAEKCRDKGSNPAGLFVSSAKEMCVQSMVQIEKVSEPTQADRYADKQQAKKDRHEAKMAEARARRAA
jgi:hypothetical protein